MDLLFSNPIMLWGLVLVSVPVVIHLLFKRQPRIELWAAMQFLERVIQKQRRRLQLQSLLHPIVQMLLIACIVIAAANPVQQIEANSLENLTRQHLIVIDQSMSTGAFDGDVTTFQREQLYVEELLKASSVGDSFQVLLHGSKTQHFIDRPTYDKQAVLQEVHSLKPGYQQGHLTQTLQRVNTLLDQVDDNVPTVVHLLSDMQREEWQLSLQEQAELARQLKRLQKFAQIKIVDVGGTQTENVAITDVRTASSSIRIKETVQVEVVLENFGSQSASVSVDLLIDGVSQQTQSVFIAEKTATTIAFSVSFAESGQHLVEVVSAADGLLEDNRRWELIHVLDHLKVLILEGQTNITDEAEPDSSQPVRQASDYLKLAFAANIQVQVADITALQSGALNQYDVIFLSNIAALTFEEATLLRQFVTNGGGLVLAVGAATQPENYNTRLGIGDAGLLPARIDNEFVVADASPYFLVPVETEHPVIRGFTTHPEAGLQSTRIYRYQRVTPEVADDGSIHRIIDSTRGDPILMTKVVGRGRVALITTAINEVWGSWVAWPSFVPIMNELIIDVSAGNRQFLETQVTEPFPVEIDPLARGGWAGPLNNLTELPDSMTNPAEDPGVYAHVDSVTGRTHYLLRQVDTTESDLSRIDKNTVADRFFGNDLSVFESTTNPLTRVHLKADHSPSGITMLLLISAVLLLLIDQCLHWNLELSIALLISLSSGMLLHWTLPVTSVLITVVSITIGATSFWLLRKNRG